MKLPSIKEIAPSESGYPVKDYSFKSKNDDKEFKERFNKKKIHISNIFKKKTWW